MIYFFFPLKFEAEEMAQELRELPVLPENLSSIPSTYTEVQNHQQLQSQGSNTLSSGLPGYQIPGTCMELTHSGSGKYLYTYKTNYSSKN